MKAKYLGSPTQDEDGPRRVGFGGKSFPRGVFIDVSDMDEKPLAKLKVHPNFEVSEEPLSDDDVTAAEVVNGSPVVSGDEAEAGATTDDKIAIISKLEALQAAHPEATVTFDGRWGVPKLKAALEAAQFELGDD